MTDRFRAYYETQTPVILRGAVQSSCMALQKWKDWDYLLQRIGPDHLCDVELRGGAYHQTKSQKGYSDGDDDDGDTSPPRMTIPFAEYVNYLKVCQETYTNHGLPIPSDHLLYMAQNDLPVALASDVALPSICTDPSVGAGKLYGTMLWMGPAGTLSPLHYDPLDNCLMQMVGRKYVYLVPRHTDPSYIYVGPEWGQQSNTSAVDVAAWMMMMIHREENDGKDVTASTAGAVAAAKADSAFPLFRHAHAHAIAGVLSPGDVLYIPAQWWHAVQSLEFSISVNAWWR